MAEIYKLDPNNYRKAKKFCKDLPLVLKIISLSIMGLEPFKEYLAVRSILLTLKEEQSVLKSLHASAKRIVETKGRIK